MKKSLILAVAVAALVVPAFAALTSGLKKGESVTPFHPNHVVGPLAGTSNCFPCTFQSRPQVQVWINGDDHKNVLAIARTLDAAMANHTKQEFKALIVLLSDGSNDAKLAEAAKSVAKSENLTHVAIAVLPKTNAAVKAYSINTDVSVKNTVLAYAGWKVETNIVNLGADSKGIASLNSTIESLVR